MLSLSQSFINILQALIYCRNCLRMAGLRIDGPVLERLLIQATARLCCRALGIVEQDHAIYRQRSNNLMEITLKQ